MNSRKVANLAFLVILVSTAGHADDWKKRTCDPTGSGQVVIDSHAHTFNFRHLPLRGILYGWGVPDLVSAIAAEILWGITADETRKLDDQFNGFHLAPAELGEPVDFMHRLNAQGVNLYDALEEPITQEQQFRFEEQLNRYITDEINYEISTSVSTGSIDERVLFRYFQEISASDPENALPNFTAVDEETEAQIYFAVASRSLMERLVGLLIKPFNIIEKAPRAFQFAGTLIQSEKTIAQRLLADSCGADYFIHYMMDLAPVYDDSPPVEFLDQHELASQIRKENDDRFITFSAFVPFRYGEHDLGLVREAVNSGAVGFKYYPPSGYSATVRELPKKPSLWRSLIFGGARKQWKHRYDPLKDRRVRANWGVTVTDKKRAEEQTLEGVSKRFFEYAIKEDLPIFAHHTSSGFEAHKGYGELFAEPCGWLPILQENEDMLLVLGHSGGRGWYGSEKDFRNSFAVQSFNLCVTFENVYCDFGYHQEVLSSSGRAALRSRLMDFSRKTVNPTSATIDMASCRNGPVQMQYSIFEKLMYGSDWMMVILEANYEGIATAFAEVFSGDLYEYREKFFGTNAVGMLRKSGVAERLPEPLKPQ